MKHTRKIYLLFILALVCAPNAAYPACHIQPTNNTTFNTTVGASFSQTFTSNGSCSTWTSSYPAGYLGLTFNTTTGTLSGTPTGTVTNYSFTVSNGGATNTYYLTITTTGCSFVGGAYSGSISFGNIDPSTAGTVYGTITTGVQFTCSSALGYTITVSPASGWLLTSGSNTMAYTLGVASSGTYGGTAVNVFPSSNSNIVQGQYANAPAGSYSNASAITVTISWAGGSIVASLPIGSVTGTIISTCGSIVNGAFSTLSINPSNNVNQSFAVSTPATVSCTKNISTTSITASSLYGASHTTPVSCTGSLLTGFTMKEPVSGDTINYSFQCNASITGLGFGSSTNVSLGIGAAVLAADVMTANYAAGAQYSDTITLTINY
ncbi:MAG: hypothetical protein ACLQBQ_06035 [Smithella sp.]